MRTPTRQPKLPEISGDTLVTVAGGKLPAGHDEALAAGERAYQRGEHRRREIAQ